MSGNTPDSKTDSQDSELIMAPRAPSSRKRRRVSSDDEDEAINYVNYTPGTRLEKRSSVSIEKAKRSLRLEELKEKRAQSARKRLLSEGQSDVVNPGVSLEGSGSHDKLKSVDDNNNYSSADESEEDDSNEGSADNSSHSPELDSEDDHDLSDFIVSEGSQEVLEQAISMKKPSIEEAHAICVQLIFSSILEEDFLPSLDDKKDRHYFDQAMSVVENMLTTKKNLVFSNAWDVKFKEMLESCPILEDETLPLRRDAICQACKRRRHITRSFSFYKESNGEMIREFRIGCFCADRASIYHRIQHYVSVELNQSCKEKLEEVQDMTVGLTADDILRRFCVEDETWQEDLFSVFQDLLNQADEWAEDGKERRRMMNSVILHDGYCF